MDLTTVPRETSAGETGHQVINPIPTQRRPLLDITRQAQPIFQPLCLEPTPRGVSDQYL
jgi:hypothetical protein